MTERIKGEHLQLQKLVESAVSIYEKTGDELVVIQAYSSLSPRGRQILLESVIKISALNCRDGKITSTKFADFIDMLCDISARDENSENERPEVKTALLELKQTSLSLYKTATSNIDFYTMLAKLGAIDFATCDTTRVVSYLNDCLSRIETHIDPIKHARTSYQKRVASEKSQRLSSVYQRRLLRMLYLVSKRSHGEITEIVETILDGKNSDLFTHLLQKWHQRDSEEIERFVSRLGYKYRKKFRLEKNEAQYDSDDPETLESLHRILNTDWTINDDDDEDN